MTSTFVPTGLLQQLRLKFEGYGWTLDYTSRLDIVTLYTPDPKATPLPFDRMSPLLELHLRRQLRRIQKEAAASSHEAAAETGER
jgi:hypothetical protein